MKRTLVATTLLLTLLAAGPAEAKVLEIWGSAGIGTMFGSGDADSDRDFFNWAGGGTVGVEVGARVLIFEGYFEYLRFFAGDTGANLASLNLGMGGSIGLGGGFDLVLRGVGAFYVGSLDGEQAAVGGQAVSSSEVKTRGIGARGGVGLRYVFARVFSVGVTPQLGYHYFFGGADQPIAENNSSGYDINLLAYFRIGVGL